MSRRATALGVLVGVVVLTIGAVAYLVGVHLPRERREAVALWEQRLDAMAEDRAAAVARWVRDGVEVASLAASFPTTRYLLEQRSGGPYPFPVEQGPVAHLKEILAEVADHGPYRVAAVVGPGAEPVVVAAGAVAADSWAGVVHRAVDERREQVVLVEDPTLGPMVALVVPVFTAPGDAPRGAVVLGADPGDWLFPFLSRRSVSSITAETFLVARENGEVVLASPLRHSDAAPLTIRVPLGQKGSLAAVVTAARSGNRRVADYRGVPVLVAVRPIRGTRWQLVSAVEEREVLAPHVAERTGVVLCFMAVVVGLAGLGFGLVRGRRASELERELESERARHAALGD